jgi:hypothetical protein
MMVNIKEKLEDITDYVTSFEFFGGMSLTGLGLVSSAATLAAGATSYNYFDKLSDPVSGIAWGALGVGAGLVSTCCYTFAVKIFSS